MSSEAETSPLKELAPLALSEIVERLEEELAAAQNRDSRGSFVLAFDADGTLWSGDIGIDLFEALVRRRGVRDAARAALAREAESLGLQASGDANELASVLYSAFEQERYPEERAFAMMAFAFAGFTVSELDRFVADELPQMGLAQRIRPPMRALVAWCEARGVPAWIVSASPRAIVEPAASLLGVPKARALGMTPRVQGGIVQPEIVPPATYGDGKRRALEAAAPGAVLLGAFGDSAYDAALLAAAKVRVAVHPSRRLLELDPPIDGLVVLAD